LADVEGLGLDAAVLSGLILLRAAVLSAATYVAALGLSGCSHHAEPNSSPATSEATTSSVVVAPTASASALPAPEVLIDVLSRLADPAVPGTDKLGLVEGATADNAAMIDKFAKALQDNGFNPLTFAATDIAWSDKIPGDVRATINITTSNPANPGAFTFPMEFRPVQDGWQLSRQTADMLLAFGNTQTGATPTPTP